jgi:hypothetical protein
MENVIVKLRKYLEINLGIRLEIIPVTKQELNRLPMFIGEIYTVYLVKLFNNDFLLIQYKDADGFSISQLENHFRLLNQKLVKKLVLLVENLSSLNRTRLIEKGINFIVPGKQMFLLDLGIDLREINQNWRHKKKPEKLLPSAQVLLLYHLLRGGDQWNPENASFTQLALKFYYTKMAITKAVDNLVYHELCKVEGTKEKYLRFNGDKGQLWQVALPLLVNPVFKRIYVDEMPEGMHLLQANESALPEYSDMNPSQQKYYAIEKGKFYDLQKNGQLKNPNEYEGKYCLELWKYNPALLTEGITKQDYVDPLSLYLSLRDIHDERVEMALETIIEKFIW